jgi:hypothetical protein
MQKLSPELIEKIRWGTINGDVTKEELETAIEFFSKLEEMLWVMEPHFFLARSNVTYLVESYKKHLETLE